MALANFIPRAFLDRTGRPVHLPCFVVSRSIAANIHVEQLFGEVLILKQIVEPQADSVHDLIVLRVKAALDVVQKATSTQVARANDDESTFGAVNNQDLWVERDAPIDEQSRLDLTPQGKLPPVVQNPRLGLAE
jgi:hypothetical protein